MSLLNRIKGIEEDEEEKKKKGSLDSFERPKSNLIDRIKSTGTGTLDSFKPVQDPSRAYQRVEIEQKPTVLDTLRGMASKREPKVVDTLTKLASRTEPINQSAADFAKQQAIGNAGQET